MNQNANEFFPTRHGDWRVVDGQLVDMTTPLSDPAAIQPDTPEAGTSKDAPGNDASDPLPPPASLPPSPPAGKKPRLPKAED